jgi:hypothetical protein
LLLQQQLKVIQQQQQEPNDLQNRRPTSMPPSLGNGMSRNKDSLKEAADAGMTHYT